MTTIGKTILFAGQNVVKKSMISSTYLQANQMPISHIILMMDGSARLSS
jgi:hypothetical protein